MNERRDWWRPSYDLYIVAAVVLLLYFLIATALDGRGNPSNLVEISIRYWLLAGGAIALSLAGAVIGFIRLKAVPTIAFIILTGCLAFVALGLSVPQLDIGTRELPGLPDDYVPCFSGTDCPGG